MKSKLDTKNKGFTLIELMIVVAIISILAAVAFPSYQESIRKSKRSDAQVALMAFAGALERHYTETDSYCGAAATGTCGTGTPTTFNTTVPLDGGTAHYNLSINAATATTYTIKATGVNSMAADKCGDFTLTSTGVKGISGADTGITTTDCW